MGKQKREKAQGLTSGAFREELRRLREPGEGQVLAETSSAAQAEPQMKGLIQLQIASWDVTSPGLKPGMHRLPWVPFPPRHGW